MEIRKGFEIVTGITIGGEDHKKEWVSVESLRKTKQFACLESWCKSRGKGVEYCYNCKPFHFSKEVEK